MKWFGQIAFATQTTQDGITTDDLTVRDYYGEVLRASKRDDANHIALDFTVNNRISIVADPFAMNTFHSIAYITFMGAKWRVSGVEVQYPRLIFDLGDVYAEETEGEEGMSWEADLNCRGN